MAQPNLFMSGLVSLDTQQTEFLEMLGLTVSSPLTAPQVQALLDQAEAVQATMDNPMIAKMTRETLDTLKADVALLQGAQAA